MWSVLSQLLALGGLNRPGSPRVLIALGGILVEHVSAVILVAVGITLLFMGTSEL
ncbi:MAG: hypothetical protein ACXWZI_14190 [Mycobacterium sp.]